MNLFLSYASQHKDLVRPVCSTLRAAGFEIFFDETDLPASEVYDDRIREAIQRSDLFVFMLSPEAVQPGRYTMTELLFAQQRWPNPRGRVVAVLPLGTAEPALPDYLRPLTLQKQVGNLAAEVLATVRRMQSALDAQLTGGAAKPAPAPASSARAAGPPAPAPSTEPAPSPPVAPAPAPSATGSAASVASFASLDLRLRATTPGAYTLSLAGAAQSEALPLPPGTDADALEQDLWQGALPAAGVARRDGPGDLPADTLPSPARVREVGQKLHDWLFAPALRERLREPLRRIDRQRGQGLRFVLNTTDAPALARLPWEFAYDAQRRDFVFADPMKPLVRWLDVDEPLPTLKVEPPLRLLIAVAAPSDRPALAVGDELAHLDAALADLETEGLLETIVLPHASLGALNDALRDFCPHVLHFIGHGDFADDEGRILLEAEADDDAADDSGHAEQRARAAAPINGRRFAVLLRNHLQFLRLVFLNSCLGATTSPRDAFGGVAQALVGHGVPAVVAMQFAIPDRIAVALSRHFYRYLASGRPVDESLTAVRALLYAQG
ncbi:MAG: CHAT domain-containing protein, partial [Rhizobacter sp.]|nr:CHAT domain-containing protein [Rhizobacter sp.]